MGWSLQIATFRGIALKVHASFALILVLGAASWAPLGVGGMAFGATLVLLLFGCVTLHEFGHALAAQRYGIPVKEVVLLPIGGVAILSRATRQPVQELVIAAAGPAVNVVIAALLAAGLWRLGEPLAFTPALLRPEGAEPSVAEAMRWLLSSNVGLVLFNLIPAFPLDGGRILRGAIGLFTDWTQATRWAARTGQILAVAMGGVALVNGQLMLGVIAMLVFMSAGASLAEEEGHTVLATRRVGETCNRDAIRLHEGDRVATVVRHLLTSYQPDFPVMRGTQLVGVVRRSQVLQVLALRGDAPVTTAMTSCPAVAAEWSLADTRRVLAEHGAPVAAVFDGDAFAGLVSLDDIAEAELVLASASRSGGTARPTAPPRHTPATSVG